jgi:hypothetical protein
MDILKPLTGHPCPRLSALSNTVAYSLNPNPGISIDKDLNTGLHYLYHSLVADLTSTVTAILSTQLLTMQVVERRGRAVDFLQRL